MALGKRLINTGAAAAAGCNTETTDIFGDSSGVALYSLDYDANTAPDGTDYSGTPSNVDFGVGGNINYGARFNGSSSGVSIAATATTPIDYASRVYSIAFWINLPAIGSSEQVITKYGTSDSNRAISIIIHTDGTIRFLERTSVSESRYSHTALTANTWHHVVVARSTTGIAFYIDGEQKHSDDAFSFNFTPNNGGTEPIRFGRNNSNTPTYGEFDLDQVRFFTSTLTEANAATLFAETACVYTATTTDNDYPTTNLAYYKLDNSAEDEKGSYDGTETDIEYRFGRFGQAAVFNGSSSIINTSVDFDTLTDYTISMWINPSSNNKYFAGTVAASTALNGIYLNLTSGNLIRFFERNNSNTVTSLTSTDTVTLNAWNHIVVVRDGSTNYIYVNNGTPVSLSNSTITHTTDFTIGRAGAFTSTYFDGSIDQVRIFSTALSSSQVTELYNEKGETDTSNFKTVLYEGNGGSQYISNVGFEPDLVWIKERTGSAWHILTDSVRGANKTIYSNDTYQEESLTNVMNSFESNGFMVAYNSAYSSVFSNKNNESYVAWVFKGGGEAVQNTQGNNINSDVSANDKGFSIVKYTAGSTIITDTVGHGVNVNGVATKPDLIIQKVTSVGSTNWFAITDVIDSSFDWLMFNDTAGKTDMSGIYANFDIGTTTFTNWYASGSGDVITYCFSSVAGYSKIGSYTSTGSAGLEITNLGFAPSFVMIKNVSDVGSWIIHSKPPTTTNPSVYHLRANSSNAQDSGTSEQIDFDSDGFTLNGTGQNINHSHGDTYIYMAFK
mgnify:CR=1 FL=1